MEEITKQSFACVSSGKMDKQAIYMISKTRGVS